MISNPNFKQLTAAIPIVQAFDRNIKKLSSSVAQGKVLDPALENRARSVLKNAVEYVTMAFAIHQLLTVIPSNTIAALRKVKAKEFQDSILSQCGLSQETLKKNEKREMKKALGASLLHRLDGLLAGTSFCPNDWNNVPATLE